VALQAAAVVDGAGRGNVLGTVLVQVIAHPV